MGFSMFFVGLGCLTGPPLAGEWITSCKTLRSQTCANLLFKMHTTTDICTAYVWDYSCDATEWENGGIRVRVGKLSLWTSIFWGNVLAPHVLLGPWIPCSFSMCVFACLCACTHYGLRKLKHTGEKQPIVSAALNSNWDFKIALMKMHTGSSFILPTSESGPTIQ